MIVNDDHSSNTILQLNKNYKGWYFSNCSHCPMISKILDDAVFIVKVAEMQVMMKELR